MYRRLPGTGSIDPLPSGRYRWRVTLADGRRLAGTRDTEEEAARALDAAREGAAVVVPVAGMALGPFGAAWLDRRFTANAQTERGLWRHHVLTTRLAGLPLPEVEMRHIKAWAEGLHRHRALVQGPGGERAPGPDPISVQTQRLCLALVRRVLSAAQLEGLIKVNPARGAGSLIDWPAEDLEAAEVGYLDEAEVAQLLRCGAIGEAAHLHYAWAIGSGARQQESWALRWRDLDLAAGQGTIRRSGARATTKAGKVRRFPLLPLAADALARWHELAPDTRPDALVWPVRLRPPAPGTTRWRSPGGMRPRGDDFGWADRSRGAQGIAPGHRTLAGLPPVTYHDLRHTCAAGLLRGYAILGVGRPWTIEEVSDFLGHGGIAVTQRYAHIAGGGLAQAAAREGAHGRGDDSRRDRGGNGGRGAGDGGEAGRGGDARAAGPGGAGGGDRGGASGWSQRAGGAVAGAAGAGSAAVGHAEVTPTAAPALALVGDRGATRTRDLLFRKQEEIGAAQGLASDRDLDVTARARDLLIGVAQGLPGDVDGLARAVLAQPLAPRPLRDAARAVIAGGPHRLIRALELAGLVLDAVADQAPATAREK